LKPAGRGDATYDPDADRHPGMIDVHSHLGWHFDKDGRYAARRGTPAEEILYSAENAYVTLMAGFTTIQSPARPTTSNCAMRSRAGSSRARVLTSIRQINEGSGRPTRFAEGSATEERRRGRRQDLRVGQHSRRRQADDDRAQLEAVCGEAKTQGLRTMVHAHSPESIKASVDAGCDQIEHGVFADESTLKLMADKGVYFDPNVGVVLQNYLRNKAKYLGIGNYNEEGFAYMEKGLGLNATMIKKAVATPNLKMVLGTDAVAGAHGHNADEIVERVRQGNQKPMDAIASATSLAAKSMRLDKTIGTLAAGYEADLVGLDGDPLTDITAVTASRSS
jgi:imidazolonepropionase-like amidohydrolase